MEAGTAAADLEPQLTNVGAWGQPIFALLDQFGGTAVPFSLIDRLAKNRSSEVMVTLAPAFFTRFVSTQGESGDAVFGSSDWRAVAAQPSALKHDFIAEQYQQTLRRAGFEFTLSFELLDEGGRPVYLLFGTQNIAGLRKMKEAMWHVDRERGIRYRDPRAAGDQLDMSSIDPLAPLDEILVEWLATGPQQVEQLRLQVLLETIYREEHVLTRLKPLRKAGRIEASPGPLTRQSIVRLP